MSGSVFAFASAPALPPFHPSTFQYYHQPNYIPKRASPLRTSRNVNLMPQAQSPSSTNREPSSSFKPRPSPTPAAHLSRLITFRREERTNAHRQRAHHRREDAYLQDRSDQLSRMEWMREQRRWEESKRRRGQREIPIECEEAEVDEQGDVGDQMMPTEEEEIEALVSYLEGEKGQDHAHGPSVEQDTHNSIEHTRDDGRSIAESSGYGSEDEDYDQLFMEVLKGGNASSFDGLQDQGVDTRREIGTNVQDPIMEDVEMS